MDSFTERILERARERQKKLQEYGGSEKSTPLREINTDTPTITTSSSQPNLTEVKKLNRKDVVSEPNLNSKASILVKSSPKATSSEDIPGTPQPQLKTLNIQKENFNMEIKVSSSENVRVEVEIEERDDDDSGDDAQKLSESNEDGKKPVLREDAKKKFQRLGKLYAGGDDADIPSPIHRTEMNFMVENNSDDSSGQENKSDSSASSKHRKGLGGLAALAKNFHNWDDEEIVAPKKLDVENKPSPKKSYKPPAPKPPSSVVNTSQKFIKPTKPPAPKPPINKETPTKPTIVSEVKINSPVGSPAKNKSRETPDTPKQLEWDKTVLKNLESQGFTRTASNTRLIYNYSDSQEGVKTSEIAKVSRLNLDNKSDRIIEEDSETEECEVTKTAAKAAEVPSKPTTPRSPLKRGPTVANKAAIFESSPSKGVKDPALLSVSERKALFEKNKGSAPVPKSAISMAMPKNTEKPKIAAKLTSNLASTKAAKVIKADAKPQPQGPTKNLIESTYEVVDSPTKAFIAQSGGIASKMAALLEGKSTIGQQQIESGIREQRQKEMDLLLNRFQRNKEVIQEDAEESEEESDEGEITETTAMIHSKPAHVVKKPEGVPPPPPPPTSGQKRRNGKSGKVVSPKVAASLEDVKRIKVVPPKQGKLYPCLSDIEATTETETEQHTASTSPNSSAYSLEENADSDAANTSFGREILQAVCQNQTPKKRPILDESTESDISDILDEMDDYLDEAMSHNASGPTPPKHGRSLSPELNNPAQTSNSFHYKNYSPRVPQQKSSSPSKSQQKSSSPSKSQFKSPCKIITSPRRKEEDLPTHVVDGDNVLPLTHTVSFYRRQQVQGPKTPVRQVVLQPSIEESPESVCSSTSSDETGDVRNKIQELLDQVGTQQTVISQTSQALNLCYSTPEFTGSTEQVEAEKVLLLATHRRQAALHEVQRLRVEGTLRPQGAHSQGVPIEKGTLTISNIILPMKREYVRALAAAGGKGHHVLCLVKCGENVVTTQLVSTVASSSKNPDLDLYIPGTVKLNNIFSDFMVTFEVYCLQAQEEILPHEVKYHINSKKSSNKITPKKGKADSRMTRPPRESPAGPQAVRSPTFALMGYVVFSIQAVNRTHWALNKAPSMSPLEGSVQMRVSCELAVTVEHRGFLTMFEDVSGFGAWHRRWCLLKGHVLSYWKYPDDERKKPPIDSLNLKNCVTQQVGPVSREICARLHTFLLETVRPAQSNDKESLVMVRKGEKTVIRHLLSADTKEERIEWCIAFNKSLIALKMWGNSQ